MADSNIFRINNIPLLTEKQGFEILGDNDDFLHEQPVQLVIECYPDNELNKDHVLNGLPEDSYVVGMKVVVDNWLSAGLAGYIFRTFGLIIRDVQIYSSNKIFEKPIIVCNFEHVVLDSLGYANDPKAEIQKDE